jgi:3-hydroxyisobutyrate dehydrogenase-like beta-hydroxyacid dehydrogenase
VGAVPIGFAFGRNFLYKERAMECLPLKRRKETYDMRNIAVIGLGLMGTPISTRLIQAGYTVTGFDIVKQKVTRLVPLGLRAARSPREAGRGADLILLSLPSWDAVVEAVEGKEGVIQGARRGQIIIDTSTSPPWESRDMGKRLAKRGFHWMDVPVSGSSVQAAVGNILFMVGGEKSDFERVKPVFDKIGKKTVYVGPSGQAATLKVAINHTLHINHAAAIEGFVLGLKAGLDPGILYEVMSSGGASSDQLASRGKEMVVGKYPLRSSISVANKDMGLSMEMGKRLGVPLPVGALYKQFLLNAHYKGWDQEDATIVMKIYEDLAGFRRKKPLSKRKRK